MLLGGRPTLLIRRLLFLARLDDLERLFRHDDTRFAGATWTCRQLRLGFGRDSGSSMAGLDQDKT